MNLVGAIRDFFNPTEGMEAETPPPADTTERFTLKVQQLGGMVICLVTDRETGVSYITKPGGDCPFTTLLDEDGKPYIED